METLLVPVDFSAASRRSLHHAVELAAGGDPRIILLHVLDRSHLEFAESIGCRGVRAKLRKDALRKLREFEKRVPNGIRVETFVCEGLPFFEILRKSEDFKVDAIVMGKFGHGTGWEKFMFGTTAEKVARGAACPVLVVP